MNQSARDFFSSGRKILDSENEARYNKSGAMQAPVRIGLLYHQSNDYEDLQ